MPVSSFETIRMWFLQNLVFISPSRGFLRPLFFWIFRRSFPKFWICFQFQFWNFVSGLMVFVLEKAFFVSIGCMLSKAFWGVLQMFQELISALLWKKLVVFSFCLESFFWYDVSRVFIIGLLNSDRTRIVFSEVCGWYDCMSRNAKTLWGNRMLSSIKCNWNLPADLDDARAVLHHKS